MTDHYAAAESDLRQTDECSSEDPLAGFFLTRAQVHATLALADAMRDPALTNQPAPMPEPRLPDPAPGTRWA